MGIEENIQSIESVFASCSDWEDKYRHIIKFGKDLDQMPEELKLEKFKVKGCQSQVWLYPEFIEGKIYFKADSDAMLVKGIISMLLKVYSGHTPDEIISHKPTFLDEIGISQHLSMNRSNGLASMIKQIKMYALAFKAMANN